ncbi:alpha/beta hydrolase [Rhodococcus sp. IEGM 1381]|uniref:alpha/beta fold hydrolase n=1 Tax=Rhodococcus sp. IEGM 1381 TaxID=3047085 RepID=UPI0024B6DA6A|nr:alpha/beta hydrolase [Rhodococcus sp. IEGM 1381]MDI9897438.1 alpha/beta hydrolase [Rhodococcus sp. IEGM 1381]
MNATEIGTDDLRSPEPESRPMDLHGETLDMLVGGEGPPLLFLHDAGSAGAWLPVHGLLAERFTVHAPSHPGFGRSSEFSNVRTVEDIAHLYASVVADLGLQRPLTVVGSSFGGWIGAELAARHPDAVDSLVLVDAAGLHLTDHPITYEFDADLQWTVDTLFHDPAAFFSLMPAEPDDAFMREVQRNALAFSRFARESNCADPELMDLLGAVSASTLVLWGELDKLIDLEHGRAYAREIPNAHLVTIGDGAHAVAVEKPKWVADNVIDHVVSHLDS